MKNYLSIFVGILFLTLSAKAQSFESRFYADLAKAPYQTLESFGQIDPTFLVLSRDILDFKMEFREARSSAKLQAVIDKAMVQIFHSKSGRAFCSVYGHTAPILEAQIAVSPSAAKQISELCLESHPDVAGGVFKPMPKKFYFVTNIPAATPFYSWTSWSNESFIFFEEQISEEELTARIIHELTVASDVKILLATSTVDSISESYGYKMKNGFMNMGSQESVRETIGAMPFPAMKFAAVALRAMVVESLIIEDVFGKAGLYKLKNPEMFSLLKSRQYEKALRQMAKAMLPLQDYLLPVEFSIAPPRERRAIVAALGETLYINEKIVNLIVDNIVNSKISFESSRGTVDLLPWLISPMIGTQSSFYSRGPRPRIGPGWSKETGDRRDVLTNEKAKSLSQGARK